MKTLTNLRLRFGQFALAAGLLTCALSASATVVSKLAGGVIVPYPGFADGNSSTAARFNGPAGMAFESGERNLYVTDRTNNAIRRISFDSGLTLTFTTNKLNRPAAIIASGSINDLNLKLTVLNVGNPTNGTIYTFDIFGNLVFTNATGLTNAVSMAADKSGNIFVTASNRIFRIAANTATRTQVAIVTNAGASLSGIIVRRNGQLAVADAGRHGIYQITTNGLISTNIGFLGVGDLPLNGLNIVPSYQAYFNRPLGLAEAGDGALIVADSENHRVKVVAVTGIVSNLYGISSNYWSGLRKGWVDGTVATPDTLVPNVEARQPIGLVMASDGSIYASEGFYHIIRKITATGLALPPPSAPSAPLSLNATTNYGSVTLTWSASVGATNYFVKRSTQSGSNYLTIASTTATTYTDTNVLNGSTYYYVVSASNAGGESPNSAEVSARPPIPPPPAPRIGWFNYVLKSGFFVSQLYPFSTIVFNNDADLAIDSVDTNGLTTTRYLAGTTPLTSDPGLIIGSTPPLYRDGLQFAIPLPVTTEPDITIKAVNVGVDGQLSAVVSAQVLFQVANPNIVGNNAAQFSVSCLTTNAVLWYTTDGSDPTNGPPSIGPIAGGTLAQPATISLNITSNLLFKVRAFRPGYAPSGIAQQNFSTTAFVPNTISFGFTSGEASSDFVASPGQTFYAPVTLSTLTGAKMYSLQFNLMVTNAGPNPGPAISPNSFSFESMLKKPIPGVTPIVLETIPPAMYVYPGANVPNPINLDGSTNFSSLLSVNTGLNLLSVGWLERITQTNLYDTRAQDLITYSQAHDITFEKANNKVIVGGYNFKVPVNATPGNTYQIKISRPSATDDGIGAPGSDVYIFAPTNSNYGGGAPLNAIKNVTVGQRKYIVGSVYPFRWFNAGDFGSSNILNADVMQVYQSAIYGLNYPPPGSDFADAMDSCGNIGVLDSTTGYYTNSFTALGSTDPLFDGNDTTINQIAFGDGVLDVCDVYVTFRRSLDPSLTWYRRFWNNGQLVADTTNTLNIGRRVAARASVQTNSPTPLVNFTAGDVVGAANQTLSVPISASVVGNYPVRMLMLNLTVIPLDGSPALTTPVTFTQTATVLGAPFTTSSDRIGNYAAVWLNSTNAGLKGSFVIGNLNIKIPAGASSTAAYAIKFDHASASPNGLASFDETALTGLLTTANRTNSTYGDGIPDSWRLRWFGTVNNSLSQSNACASGDGVNNWQKYVAGVDPSVAGNFPKLKHKSSVPSGATAAIYWPTVNGKKYVIERSGTLFNGSWSAISTNIGTGTEMQFNDDTTNRVKFYRVRILP